jgi:hypothetical protein
MAAMCERPLYFTFYMYAVELQATNAQLAALNPAFAAAEHSASSKFFKNLASQFPHLEDTTQV